MNIIICGAGMVGFSISKQLQAQGHSVTVIDQSSEDIKKIEDLLETGKIKKFKVKDFKKFGSQRKLYNFNIDNISDY